VFNNPTSFSNTPFDGPTYKSVIDRFASAAAAAAQDGGKAAVEALSNCAGGSGIPSRISAVSLMKSNLYAASSTRRCSQSGLGRRPVALL